MSDVVVNQVDVVEIVASPHSVTEVIGNPQTGLVEVVEIAADVTIVEDLRATTVDLITAGPVGPRGPEGPEGPQGPYAPQFIQHFANEAYVWVIHHGMDSNPVVTLWDLDGNEISGDVSMPDRNTVVVEFMVPFAGTAILKA